MASNVTESEMTLREYLQTHDVGEFDGTPQYFRDGDFLTVFFSDEIAHAQRIDEILTIYVSDATGEMVGCKIKGIRQLVSNVRSIIEVEHDNVSMELLLLSAVGNKPPKERYYDVREKARGMTFDASQLSKAA